MAGAYRRKADAARGVRGRYTVWWVDETGQRRTRAGYPDKSKSLELARKLQMESDLIRDGLLDPKDHAARGHAQTPIRLHVEAYRQHLLAKGDTTRHANHTAGAILKLFAAEIPRLSDLRQDRLQRALAARRSNLSARTANHALGAARAFLRWCYEDGRLSEVPRWLGRLKPFAQTERTRTRRALATAEVEQLLAATETGPDVTSYGPTRSKHSRKVLSGPDRAMLYRVAMGTGFRAKELRSLTPDDFDLSGQIVTCRSAHTKNRKLARQPIRADLCERLATWLSTLPPGEPCWSIPWDTAEMLRDDLARAGVPYETPEGVVDFHALRHSFISNLIAAGVDPKTVQVLARHSTITLTIDRYSHTDDQRKRDAVERGGKDG